MADLGTIRGQMILDVKQALGAYTQVRQMHLSTVTALHTGAGAMTASGAAIAAAGTLMVGGFVAAIGAAAEFEKKLDFFQAVTNSTAQEMSALSDEAFRLGVSTRFSASEIADSFIELGKSGQTAKDIIDGVGEGVANLAAAADDISLADAANVVTGALATFQLGADQAVHIADQLAGAANASTVSVSDLGTSLKYVGGIAYQAGLSFEDTTAALGILGVAGIRGSTAGTSLRQVLLSLSGTTPKATEALRELGIIAEDGSNAFYDSEGNLKSFVDILEILKASVKGLNPKETGDILGDIFPVRSLPSLIALMNSGKAGFEEMMAAIGNVTAAEVASAQLDNLAGDVQRLQETFQTMLTKAGGPFQEMARSVVQAITNMLTGFMNLPTGLQAAITGFVGVSGVILVVVGTMGIFAGSILNMIALATLLKDAMVVLKGTFAAYRTALAASTAAQWLFNIAAAANPIGLVVAIILAVIAAIVLLIMYWDDVKKAFTDNPWLTALFPLIGIIVLIQNHMEEIKVVIGEVARFFVEAWNNIVTFFTEAGTNIGNVVQAIGDGLYAWFVQPWINAGNFIRDAFNNVVTFVTQAATNVISFFQQLPGRILSFIQALPGMIGYAIGFVLGTITRVFLNIGTWLATNVPLIIENVVSFFTQLPARIGEVFWGFIFMVTNAFTTVWDWITTNVPLIIDNVIQFFQQLPLRIALFLLDVYNNVVNFFAQAGAWLATNVPIIINNVVTWFQNLPAMIMGFLVQVVSNIRTAFTNALNTAREIATNIFNGIRDALNGLPALVQGIFNNVVAAVRNAISGAIAAVTDFASGLWEGFKDGLGIHSPSYIERAMWAITDVTATETARMKDQVRTLQTLGNGISEIGNNLGFGGAMDGNLEALYRTVKAAKDLEAEMAFGATVGVESAQMQTLAEVNRTLKQLRDQPRFMVDKLEVNQDGTQDIEQRLPNAIRKTAYVLD